MSVMLTLRVFIAIELSDESRVALTDLQNRLKTLTPPHTVRWTTPTSIHLTLHFLGDIPSSDVAKITELTRSAASSSSPFSLTLSGLDCFPNTRRPRILWVGITGQLDSLIGLHQALSEPLKTLGFSLDARPYSPHLTLGRVKEGIPPRQLTQLGQALEQAQEQVGQLSTLPVREINLMQSELKTGGPVYTQLASAAFKP